MDWAFAMLKAVFIVEEVEYKENMT
jgi:hypothetical protein